MEASCCCFIVCTSVFAYYYVKFGKLIDERLTGQIYQNTSRVFSAPSHIFTGEKLTAADLTTYLRHAGYQDAEVDGAPGIVTLNGATVEIRPSKDSYFHGGNALKVSFAGGAVSKISQLNDGMARDFADLEPEVITNLFDESREKRRIVRFEDLPKNMIDAVLAAEDKRFFEHGGLDIVRVFRRGAGGYAARSEGAGREHDRYAGGAEFLLHYQARMAAQGERSADGDGNQRALFENSRFSSCTRTKCIWAIAGALRFAGSARRRKRISARTFAI